ncbi:MAG: TonB-dependent receptor [Caulobacterales bacterium]
MALSASILASSVNPALAQENATVASDDDIVVTGRQRSEEIQDVPLAISAFSESFIEAAVPVTLTDFQRYTPNVSPGNLNFTGNALCASIRGLGFADLEKTFEPTVGVSVDGVFSATSTGAAFDVFDVQSIEILRGPQGTLAGRNTVGGAINVRRSDPTGEFGVRVGARFANHNARDDQMVFNTPSFADDQLSAKIFAFHRSNDLFATNLARPSDQEQGLDVFTGGATLRYDHAPGGFTAQATIDVITDRSQFVPPVNFTRPGAEAGSPVLTFCDLGGFIFGSTAGCGFRSNAEYEAAGVDKYRSPIPFRSYIDGAGFTGEANWELANGATLTAISGWRSTDELLNEENTGSPGFFGGAVPILISVRVQEFSQWSQEVRLGFDVNDNFSVVTGVYYLNSDYSIEPGSLPPEAAQSPVRAQAFAFGAPGQIYTAGQERNSWAGYAEAVIGLSDTWEVTVGARYTQEEKDFRLNSRFQGNIPGTNTPDPSGIFNFQGAESWDALTGRVIVDWQPSEDILVYGGWSRGFRSGGWNGRATRLSAVGPYDPETVDSYEIGLRADLFNGRLRFNPTYFYASYQDQQAEIIRPSQTGTGTETVVENAASATISGVELEVQWAASENFRMRGAFGWLSAEYDEFFVRDVITGVRRDVANQRNFANVPDFNASIVADYTWPLSNGDMILLQGSYSWVGNPAGEFPIGSAATSTRPCRKQTST